MKRTFKSRRFAGMLLASVFVLVISFAWSGRAAGQAPQTGVATAPQAGAPAGNARTGNSVTMDATGLLVQRRRFDAGNRTYWHSHATGFVIFVESGKARVQKRGEAMKELGPGETDYTPPNVMHWHGAAPGQEFIQVGVSFGGEIKFAEPVTDAEYQGSSK